MTLMFPGDGDKTYRLQIEKSKAIPPELTGVKRGMAILMHPRVFDRFIDCLKYNELAEAREILAGIVDLESSDLPWEKTERNQLGW